MNNETERGNDLLLSENEYAFLKHLENSEYLIAKGTVDREESIAILKKYGVNVTPDGKKVEDYVITMDQWRQKVSAMKP